MARWIKLTIPLSSLAKPGAKSEANGPAQSKDPYRTHNASRPAIESTTPPRVSAWAESNGIRLTLRTLEWDPFPTYY
jgi:hypothetical protein